MKKLLTILFLLPFLVHAQFQGGIWDLHTMQKPSTFPTINISPTFLSNFTNVTGTASATGSITYTCTSLTANLSITLPSGFEGSINSGSSYATSFSITPSSGNASGTLLVRVAAATAAGSPSGNVVFSSTGATTKNCSVTATVSSTGSPTISSTQSTMTLTTTVVGNPGNSSTSFISGSNLTANISVSFPAGVAGSTDNITFSTSAISITQSGGAVNSAPLYLRLTGASVGNPSGNVALSSTGASTINIAVSGSVVASASDTVVAQFNFNNSGQSVSGWTDASGDPGNNHSLSFTDNRSGRVVGIHNVAGQWVGIGSGSIASSNTAGTSAATVFPTNVGVSLWFHAPGGTVGGAFAGFIPADSNLVITNLDPTALYKIETLNAQISSNIACGTANTSVYIQDSTNLRVDSATVDTRGNNTTLVTFLNKKPNAAGTIYMGFYPQAGGVNGNCNQYGILNGMRITKQATRQGFDDPLGIFLLIGLALGLLRKKKMSKVLILSGGLILLNFTINAQSEASNYVTYDTTIALANASSVQGGNYPYPWKIRVTRQSDYFTKIAADSNNRERIFLFMPGAGEVQTGNTSDSSYLSLFGFHYWLQHGYTGAIKLGNGTHYPIWITVLQPGSNTRPWFTLGLLRSLKNIFHPRNGKFDVAGLSQGSYEWGCVLGYSNNTTGDHEAMTLIESWVDLQGVGPETFQNSGSPLDATMPASFGTWASTYGGHMWGLEGTGDTRNIWQITQAMNTAKANTGYFTFENYGTQPGSHCCWNTFYDPSATNWYPFTPYGQSFQTGFASPPNTLGNYFVDATNGSNVFQWMMRQGDTTLLGSCNPQVSAGSSKSIFQPATSVSVTGTATPQCSHTISSTLWTQTSGPNTAGISAPSSLTTNFTGLIVGTYTFLLTATDNSSLTGNSSVTVTVASAISPTVTAGSNQTVILPTNNCTLTGTATGNGGATISSTTWSQVSGPGTATIVSVSSLSTIINNLIQGIYVFKLSATDNNSNSNSASVTITVTPANTSVTAKQQVYQGEYTIGLIDSLGRAYGMSSNLGLTGSGGAGIAGVPQRFITSPTTLKIRTGGTTLHGLVFVDTAGNVWSAGGNDQGQAGNGTIGNTLTTPAMMTTDSSGATFGNVAFVCGSFASNVAQGLYLVKNDGTIWMTGDTRFGMRGDGYKGDTVTRPVKIGQLPGGRVIIQLSAEKFAVALASDGTVWTTGGSFSTTGPPPNYAILGYVPVNSATDYLTWHQLTIPNNDSIIQVAGGDIGGLLLGKTGKLYGFGTNSGYLGNSANTSYTTPTDLNTNITSYFPATVTQISSNSNTFHVILNDGSLWGWGDNAQGCVGNGVEINFATWSTPYSYDPAQILGLPQYHPVQITNKHNFVAVYTGNNFVFSTFAQDANGQLYSCGRNKGAILGNAVVECTGANGDQSATYSNSWDVPYLTPINPFSLTSKIPTISPICISTPGATYCSECTNPAVTSVANPGSTQNINSSTTLLNATGSTVTGGSINYYLWSQVSGPTTAVMDVVSSPKVNVSGLGTGTYVFQLKIIDNAWNSHAANVTVNVNNSTNCNCLTFPKPTKIK